MSKFTNLLDDIRSWLSGGHQTVYDPSYVYTPWKKWIIGAVVAILAMLIAVGVINTRQTENDSGVPAQSTIPQTQSPQQNSELYYQVMKVVDGDTIDVLIDEKIERLRLIGIDTPEIVDPREVVQCFGKEASDKAKSILQNASVYLKKDPSQGDRDKYDRLLRYVYLKDGTNFNERMISEGYAHEYTYRLPYKYQIEFKAAEASARDNSRGLWSASTCSGNTTSKVPASSSAQSSATPAAAGSGCDSNYSPCVPISSYDLDCIDISTSVRVIGTDIHRFDRDGDGYGCESN